MAATIQPKLESFNLTSRLLEQFASLGKQRGFRLVAGRKTKLPPNTRLATGNFIADIVVDRRQPSVLCHWIVQRIGCAEILYWGQESTFAEAEQAAANYLHNLNADERKQA